MGLQGFSKDKMVFDTSVALDENDNVGAFVRAEDGTLITHSTDNAKERLDVSAGTEFYEDTAHVSGDKGNFVLGVRHDADTSLVDADGDYAPLQIDQDGRLKVSASIDVDNDFVYPEDSAHVSGALGAFTLAVRYDALTTGVSTNGDYDAFKTNDDGALWVAAVGDVADDAAEPAGANNYPVKVGTKSRWGALVALSTDGDRADLISDKYRRAYVNSGANISMLAQPIAVTNAAAVLLASNLSGRRSILIQNLNNQAIWIGHDATVTNVTGLRVSAGAALELEIGEDISVFAISTAATADVRVLELA